MGLWAMSKIGESPIGFWKFVIVVTVGLTIVQKFLIRDPNLQFLRGVPVFVVAIVLWGAYRYFFKPIRILEMVRTPTPSARPDVFRGDASLEPAPREARLKKVLTAEHLKRRTHTQAIVTIVPKVEKKLHQNLVRYKTVRQKTARTKMVRMKRAPSRFDPNHL